MQAVALALFWLLAACSSKPASSIPTLHVDADGTWSHAGTDEDLCRHEEIRFVIDAAASVDSINEIALPAGLGVRRARLRVGTQEVEVHLLPWSDDEQVDHHARAPLPAFARLRVNGVILRDQAGRKRLTIPQLSSLPKQGIPLVATWFLQRLSAAQAMAALEPLSRAFTHLEVEYTPPPRHKLQLLPFPEKDFDTTAPEDD